MVRRRVSSKSRADGRLDAAAELLLAAEGAGITVGNSLVLKIL